MSKITQKQLNEWKEKYGAFYELPVEDKTAFLRPPTMADFKRGFKVMQSEGEFAFAETMLNILFIGGDEEIKTDLEYLEAARKELQELIDYPDADVQINDDKTATITISGAKCKVRKIEREDIKIAERKNPTGKPFVTNEKLFEHICLEKDNAFINKDNPNIRMPLYKAVEDLKSSKIAMLKKH